MLSCIDVAMSGSVCCCVLCRIEMRANYLRLLTTSEGVYQYTVTYRCGRGGGYAGVLGVLWLAGAKSVLEFALV